MKFSIVVPVFNAEKYLSGCVSCVAAQTEPGFELILVDDGSDAPCAAACDALQKTDGRVRVLHTDNQGPLAARLRGIAEAKGDYVLFLDADDAMEPTCLQTLDDAIRRYASPDMLIFSFRYEDPDGAVTPAALLFGEERVFEEKGKRELCGLFFTGTLLNNVWTKAVKREVFSRRTPDLAPFAFLRCAEDRLLSMAWVANAADIVFLPERLYRYRRFPGSATRVFSPDAVERFNTAALYPTELGFIRRWALPQETVLRLQASYVGQAVYVLDRFYRNIGEKDGRDRLIAYPWKTFVPAQCLQNYQTNPFLSDAQKRLFSMMLINDGRGIRKYFRHKQTVKRLKELKKKLIP